MRIGWECVTFGLTIPKMRQTVANEHFKSCTLFNDRGYFLWFTMHRRIRRIKMLHLIMGTHFSLQLVEISKRFERQSLNQSDGVRLFVFLPFEEIANSCDLHSKQINEEDHYYIHFYMSCNSLHCWRQRASCCTECKREKKNVKNETESLIIKTTLQRQIR